MDKLEQKIIQAIKEEAIKDILKDEESKMHRRYKIVKFVTTILSVAALLVVGVFTYRPTEINYKAIACNRINDMSPESTDLLPSRGENNNGIDSYNEIITRLKDTTETDKKAVIKLAEDFRTKFKDDDEEYSPFRYNIPYIIALCHLYNGDVEKAESILQDLNNTADPEWYFKSSVADLLSEIKR